MPKYPKMTTTKIKYDSPSGYVNIGKYIPPFEKVKKGFGYMGVVVEDCKSGKLQCHICGNWYGVFNSHLSKKHNMNSNEYREMFGLSRSTALKSKKVRLRQSEVMIENRAKHKKYRSGFKKNNSYANNRKNKQKSQEVLNKYGICDLQLAHKVLLLKQKLNKTPTLLDLKSEYGGVIITHLNKRYGSYVEYCRTLELNPNFSSYNPKYSREYFIEKALSNEVSHRIFTNTESRNFYKYFKNGIKELKDEVNRIKKEGKK